MTRESFITEHPIVEELERRGFKVIGEGNSRKCKCPLHEDKNPSMSIDVSRGLWKCHAGCGGGSVIDLIAKLDNVEPGSLLKSETREKPFKPAPQAKKPESGDPNPSEISKIYSYENELGEEVYQAVRLNPKSFRQRHRVGFGWAWNMNGVARVLYRLPEISKEQTIAIAEGEKDVETLVSLGWQATCNVGGAGKWLEGYTDTLSGRDVIIFGDNDDAGRKHVSLVFESIAGKAKTVKLIKIPDTYKDISEYVESFNDPQEAKPVIQELINNAHPFIKGVAMPLYSMADLESRYEYAAKNASSESLDLRRWMPSLHTVRPLVPGEVLLIIGDTGTGKTALLQSLALASTPLPTVFFEIELPAEVMFERFISAQQKLKATDVEKSYANGIPLGKKALDFYFPNLFICDDASLTIDKLESMIVRSDLVLGCKPKLVLLDYIQLLGCDGESRYDRASHAAESIKRIAKRTKTIIVMASQRGRPKEGKKEVSIFDGKDSGSLENSSGVVIGAWRDDEKRDIIHMKVLKATRGGSGTEVTCNFNGETMHINECSDIDDDDIPRRPSRQKQPAQRELNSTSPDP